MISNFDDTISAIATVIGTGGVSIIRLSGSKSLDVIKKIFFINKNFKTVDFTPNTITHGYIYDEKTLIDEVIVLYFKSPKSYTGEDVVEIQCHGGVNVTKIILDLTIKNGARLAQKGEFTKRAFLNGKMDLSQAESVLDIISAKTKKMAEAGASNLCGKLSKKISDIRDDVVNVLSHIVAAIDFPEEVEEPNYPEIKKNLQDITEKIDIVLAGAQSSNLLRQGAKIAIVGKPNVGKSSLFNSLLNYDRAIVTDIAGTTRDTISETIDINGIPATLIDTAGIREIISKDENSTVENIGINYSKQSINESDLVLFVTDLSNEPTQDDYEIFDLLKDKKYIIIGTKSDIPMKNKKFDVGVTVSNTNKTGITETIEAISDLLKNNIDNESTEFFTNSRQQESLLNTKKALNNAAIGAENHIEQDFLAIDIKSALMHLGEITGDDITQEILNNIFEKFCIGK